MPIFVVQRHEATHLHFDFRLEMDGVLKSWAVPKEPPTDVGYRRLAVAVDDHDLSYADFEGVIPEGYGAGTVKIWDRGTYSLIEKKKDEFVLKLDGKRMKGEYVLVKMRLGNKNWLLFKTEKR
jgi:DNA ligase D-like protein (predicted 3'-phosphoesterase)